MSHDPDFQLSPPEVPPTRQDPFGEGEAAARARKLRSIGIAVALLVFAGLVFAVSVLRLSGQSAAT